MKPIYRVMAVALISIGFAAALSVVPQLDGTVKPAGTETPVFRADDALALTDRNLVDLFAKSPLHLDIAHVEWSNAILSVDLKAKPNEPAADVIYDDLYELARLGFSGTQNVSQLLVRVMEQPEAAAAVPQLLLAMDAKRSDLTGGDPALRGKGTKEQFLSSHFSLTYTHKWLDRRR